ncbi:adenylate/guanylate cyclase domain-containing protein [Nonomuraea sp. NPDC049784]|uniref:adenylate/guanylate cyclase domain-containing protein n=1 Tax=Nonomuraea sp. NPDC049784 TaxID=3154361 RepID=UPI003410EC57
MRKVVTVLFCDLSGSTAMSRRFDPESLRAVLLRYFELMRSCLIHHGGTVEKYIGDAVMAVFGVPTVHEDDAIRAVRAAWEMRAAITNLNVELMRELGCGIGIRIGVNTGEVVAVDAATGDHTFVSGEIVNIAARLEQHAPSGEILLGESTYRMVSGAVTAEAVPPLDVKGVAEPLPAWQLREVRAHEPPVRRRFDVPLIGRERELKQLSLLLEGVRQDRACHVCTIFGDPGMGKSRLAQEFIMVSRSSGSPAVSGGCSPYGGGTLTPFDGVLTDLLNAVGTGNLAEAFADTPQVATALAGVLRDGASGLAVEDTFWAIREAFSTLAGDRSVVVVLDDLQWASSTTLDLITFLAESLHGVAVFFLCLARFELLDARPQWGGGQLGTTSIVLRPLGHEHAHTLAANLSEVSAHMSSDDMERLVATAEGNPFFLEQLITMRTEELAEGIPASLQALLAARLDLLTPEQLEWLRWAAFFDDFTPSHIAELSAGVQVTDNDMNHLVRRRFIEPDGKLQGETRYRFGSSQVRDVTYSALPKKTRAERHIRIAHWMRDRSQADADVGGHLESALGYCAELRMPNTAGLAQEAGAHLDRAGRTALSLGDVCRARSFFERALAVAPDRVDTMVTLVDVLAASGETGAADRLLDELERSAGAGRPELAAHGRLQRAVLHVAELGMDHMVAVAEEALPIFRQADDHAGLTRCWLRLGQASQAHHHFAEARRRFEQALTYAHDATTRLEVATTLGGLASCLWQGPEPAGAALRRCDELVEQYAGMSKATRIAIECPRALLCAMRGRPDDARRTLNDAERTVQAMGHVTARATIPIFLGKVELLAGDLVAAERAFRTSRAAFEDIGDGLMQDTATVDLARAVYRQGRAREALDWLDSCGNLTEDLLPMETALRASLRARIRAESGADMSDELEKALALSGGMQSPQCHGMVLLDAAHAFLRAGHEHDGLSFLRQARDSFAAKEDLVDLALTESLLADMGCE